VLYSLVFISKRRRWKKTITFTTSHHEEGLTQNPGEGEISLDGFQSPRVPKTSQRQADLRSTVPKTRAAERRGRP
jgi:hypothetical protein